jgi:hypothetical protein
LLEFNESAIVVNMATDGDPSRRNALDRMREPNTSLPVLHEMPFFSTNLLYGEFGIDFDIRHIIKRIRGMLISSTRTITLIKRSFDRQNIELLLESEINLFI